jgi:integrase
MKLTTTIVRNLELPSGKNDHVFWDEDLPGFGYRMHRSSKGIRSAWIIQYRIHNGRSRRMTIGSAALAANEARKLAAQQLARVKIGADPRGDKIAARKRGSKTLLSLINDFLADNKDGWRESTERQYRLILLVYFKSLHHMEATAITRADIAPVLKCIEREHRRRGAVAAQNPGRRSAALAQTRLNTLYIWAIGEGRLDSNPVIGTREIKYSGKRERVLTDDELIRIWQTCGAGFFPRSNGNFGRIVRLLILLGARRNEIACMAWSELNEKGNWTLPARRSKNHRALTLRLPPAALAILAEVPRRGDNVFSKTAAMNIQRYVEQLRERTGIHDWSLHDLRRTTATGMGKIGIQPHIIECVLNHRSGFRAGVAGVYNLANYDLEVTQALLRWSEYVTALVEGRDNKVVALSAATSRHHYRGASPD